MILDKIENYSLYKGVSPKLEKGFEFIMRDDIASLEPGKYEIDGKDIYAMVQEYEARPHEQGKWEAHRKYIDIQCIIKGEEIIGYANIEQMKALQPYNPEKDVMFFEGEGELIRVRNGYFMILFPEDVHMPCLKCGENTNIKKVVVKILID